MSRGLCAEHQVLGAREARGRRHELPEDWEERRARVLARDGWRCRLRFAGCTVLATEVHHVGAADNHSLAALLSACGPCHARASQREGAAARRSR